MVSLHDIRDYVASLFIMLNENTVILFRIEFLVVLVTLVFFAMFLMDFYRRIIHNSFMRAVFSVLDAVSDSIVVYLLGAMQTAPFKNQMFPVWAHVLVNFRYSADYISGYGVPDRRGRRFTEWNNAFKLMVSASLNWELGHSFPGPPLWLLWVLQMGKSAYRFLSHNRASRAVWHGRSSVLVAEHMRGMHEHDDQVSGIREECHPVTMKGYRYLVYGETNRFIRLKKPQYELFVATDQDQQDQTGNCSRRPRNKNKKTTTTPPPALITLDKIWDCPFPQQLQGKVVKDLPLAFALSRLLRCRFEDVTLQRCIFDTNRDLVKSIVAGKVGTSDALRIMELQLAFVHDYFNTRYPMVFWCGLPSLYNSLCLSMLTIGAVAWLGVGIIRKVVYNPPTPRGELEHQVKGVNVDAIITWLFIILIIVREVWEMRTYLRSDWTSLLKACEHVQRSSKCDEIRSKGSSIDTWMYCVLLYISRPSRITGRRWHGFIDQYVLVESYDDRPRFWNLIHILTTGIVPKKDDGAKLSSPVRVTDYVRLAVLEKLSELVEDGDDGAQGKGSRLPGFIKTLSNSNLREELKKYQAYTARPSTSTAMVMVLPTWSHIILVWHIATSLCEMELATKHGVDLGDPAGFLSWFSPLCSSKPYLMDVDDDKDRNSSSLLPWVLTNYCCPSKSNDDKTEVSRMLPVNLRKAYIVANSLSRYCAYLLVSRPDLTPDSFLVPKIVFRRTVKSARDGIFEDSGSLQERYRALKDQAEKPTTDTEREDVLKQGAALGKELLKHPTEEGRWEILADVWTELLIHTAPTWNALAHKKCLSAGEFITHIWALLWHCGIQKSSLWPKDTGPENNDPQPQVGKNGSDRAAGIERRQAGGDTTRGVHHIGIDIDEANDNKEKGTNELEASDSSPTNTAGLLRMEGTGASEIEEISGDTTTNVSRQLTIGLAENSFRTSK